MIQSFHGTPIILLQNPFSTPHQPRPWVHCFLVAMHFKRKGGKVWVTPETRASCQKKIKSMKHLHMKSTSSRSVENLEGQLACRMYPEVVWGYLEPPWFLCHSDSSHLCHHLRPQVLRFTWGVCLKISWEHLTNRRAFGMVSSVFLKWVCFISYFQRGETRFEANPKSKAPK